MKGLLINDCYSLETYILFYTALNIVYGVLFIPSQGTSTFIALAIGISISLVYRSVIGEESSKWTLYALVTKASRRNYVLSKFLLLPIVTLGAAVEAFLIILIYNIFTPAVEFAFSEINILTAAACMSYIIIMGSVVLTLSFYFGYDKLIMLLMVILVVPVLLINLASPYIIIGDLSYQNLRLFFSSLPFLTAVVWYICFRISVKIFERKDL